MLTLNQPETGAKELEFTDHTGDVMALALSPSNPNIFTSTACDRTAKLWDTRKNNCVQTFTGHEAG